MDCNRTLPKLTVLMPVYNGVLYLHEAIESILGQTFWDYELLIIDDGSSDNSVEIIRRYEDPRIRFIGNKSNLGLVATLNKGIELARGKYLARMDCDDISLPRRLEKQVEFMEEHPEIGICGTWVRTFGGIKDRIIRFPTEPNNIHCVTFFNSCISHPSMIMRMSSQKKHLLYYDPRFRHAEDYALWVEASKHFEMANLGEVLHLYRQHPTQITVRHYNEQYDDGLQIRLNQIIELGVTVTDEEFELHNWLASPTLNDALTKDIHTCNALMVLSEAWFEKLTMANDAKGIYPQPAFSRMLFGQWFIVCIQLLIAKGPSMIGKFRFIKHLDKLGLKHSYLIRHLIHVAITRLIAVVRFLQDWKTI